MSTPDWPGDYWTNGSEVWHLRAIGSDEWVKVLIWEGAQKASIAKHMSWDDLRGHLARKGSRKLSKPEIALWCAGGPVPPLEPTP